MADLFCKWIISFWMLTSCRMKSTLEFSHEVKNIDMKGFTRSAPSGTTIFFRQKKIFFVKKFNKIVNKNSNKSKWYCWLFQSLLLLIFKKVFFSMFSQKWKTPSQMELTGKTERCVFPTLCNKKAKNRHITCYSNEGGGAPSPKNKSIVSWKSSYGCFQDCFYCLMFSRSCYI